MAAVPSAEPPEFGVTGRGGGPAAAFRAGSLQLRVAGRDLSDPNVVTLDFARLNNLDGVEISGLIGYPMLSRCTLTLDYRDGLIGPDRDRLGTRKKGEAEASPQRGNNRGAQKIS